MAFKKKTKKTSKKVKASSFEKSDFSILAASDATYTEDYTDTNGNFSISVPFGTTSTVTSFVSATFSPVSAISSVPIDVVLIAGNSRWGTVGTDQGSLPLTLINDGLGSSQVIQISATYDNILNISDLVDTGLGFQYQFGVASLSAGSSDTIGIPGSASRFVGASYTGALTAVGGGTFVTPTISAQGVEVAVPYNTVQYLTGNTASFASLSSLLGDNTGLTAVSLDVSLSASDSTYFGSISSSRTLPAIMTVGESLSWNVPYTNTYLHADDIYTTANGVVDVGTGYLSAGWNGTFVDPTLQYTSTIYTMTALGDAGAPSGVSGFSTTNGQTRVRLNWTNPSDSDLSATKIQYALGTVAPSAHTEGTTLYAVYTAPSIAVETTHTGLTASQSMAYSIWTVDTVNEWSSALVQSSATPFHNNIYGTTAFPYLTPAQIRAKFIDEGII